MITEYEKSRHAVVACWEELERWINPNRILSFSKLPTGWREVHVRDIVEPITERIQVQSTHQYKLAGVKWYGEGLFHRETVEGSTISSTKLAPVKPGAIIYNRLFAWKASFAVVPRTFTEHYVSSEFPQFYVKPDQALAEYLYLFFTTQRVLNAVISASTGSAAVSRNRFKEVEFLRFKIPLPPISEQNAIVSHWHNAKDNISAAFRRAEKIEKQLESKVLKKLNLEIKPQTLRRGASAITWHTMERWDTFFYREDFVALDQSLSEHKYDSLGNLVNFVSRAWRQLDFPDGTFRYIEISSVSKKIGIHSERKVEVTEAPSRATTLIRAGDIIISTTRPYLGAFAIVPQEYDGCICSSGFAVIDKVDESQIIREYLLFFLKSSAGLSQLERRMTGGLYPAITQSELEKIKIPLPPLRVQESIVKDIISKEAEIAKNRELAERSKTEVYADVKALIFGTKQVSDI